MPFRSTAQQRFMYARHPEIAHRWSEEMKQSKRPGAKEHPIRAARLPGHVGKKLSLRKPKAVVDGPRAVMGVVHRGQSGVGIFHQGKMTAWGPSESAAWSAHQVSQVGKNDPWAANLEVPLVPEYRGRRANYRSGTSTVGKRQTGAVLGTAVPKRVQATRAAARKTPGAGVKINNTPPIPASQVGKRDRRYNPEANRQRRLGGAAALSTGAGALLLHRGVKGVREATTLARRGIPFAPTAGRPAVILEEEGKAKRVIPVPERTRVRANDLHARGITASRGDIANVAGGAGLIGAGVGINRHGRSRANREWR